MKKATTYVSTFFCAAILCLNTMYVQAQEVGLQLYSLREQFKTDVPGTLKLINGWGIKSVEVGDSYGMSVVEFKKLLDNNNLQAVSVGATYKELRNSPKRVIGRAKIYGAKYVMCAWIPHSYNTFGIKETQKAISTFNNAGKLLRDHGLELVYHPHGYEFRPFRSGTLFDFMADNAVYFKFEMDVFWVQHAGKDPLVLLKRYPDKFILMHLKDMEKGIQKNDTGRADVESNVVLGFGEIDIQALMEEARRIGIRYLFIEDESSKAVDQIPKSLAYLRGL